MCARGTHSGAWGRVIAAAVAVLVGAVLLPGTARAQQVDPGEARTAVQPDPPRQAARRIAAAAAWRVDPRMLQARPTDSPATAAAREGLALLSAQVHRRLAAYDAARARASAAADAAREARARLRAAREELRDARADFLARKDLLVTMLTTSYTSTRLAPLSVVLSADRDDDVIGTLTRLEELSRSQTAAVNAADRARTRLAEAVAELGSAEQQATSELAAARVARAVARQQRESVLRAARRAEALVEASVAADHLAREELADGYRGGVVFPLAAGVAFSDLDNFGADGPHWAARHTGDDLSAACGSVAVAATGGTVTVRTDQAWSGPWLVMVRAAGGSLTTWYAHLQALAVTDGQRVQAGDPIGEVGELGNASGCHLHLEVHPTGGGIYEDGVDPAAWLVEMGAYPGR